MEATEAEKLIEPDKITSCISDVPYPVVFGNICGAVIALGPLIILAIFKWIVDNIFHLLCWLRSDIRSDSPLFCALNTFALVTVGAIGLYMAFFLLICLAEVFSDHLRRFIIIYVVVFGIGFGLSYLWMWLVIEKPPFEPWGKREGASNFNLMW
ncbi:unnamed protein product [Orchesella dallaii]|uniref:Uncharacterized protein n=1 Tax=Orchesella dallaii TaxID=48710 RepID=A0ABP1QRU1_9HEXA